MKQVLAIVFIISAILLSGSIYTVSQTEQALKVNFGDPSGVVNGKGDEPGLHFKRPFMFETIYKFDRKILGLSLDPIELLTQSDSGADDGKKQQRLIVDAFLKYRITDPLKFYRSVTNEAGLETRLIGIFNSSLRAVVGETQQADLLTDKRLEVMDKVKQKVSAEVANFGITIVDVRTLKVDFPKSNSEGVYKRMRTEREKEARELRAQGEEEATRIKAGANKDREILLANAKRNSMMLRGEGDAEATRIFAEAFGKDEKFFMFYRSMQAYKETLKKENTTMVLSPDNEFLQFFDAQRGATK